MDCPKCGLTNPDSAMRCDCGYDFESQQMEEPFVTKPSEEFGFVKLEPEMVMARNILFGIFAFYIVLEALLVFFDPEKFAGVVRMLLTVLLMYFVMSGHSWAKWTMIILYYFGALFGLNVVYESYAASPLFTIIMVVFTTVFAAIATFMLVSKPLNRYFIYKQERSAP